MAGIFAFFAAPLVGLLTLLLFRMSLEMTIVLFRIESNTRETKDLLREIKEQLGQK